MINSVEKGLPKYHSLADEQWTCLSALQPKLKVFPILSKSTPLNICFQNSLRNSAKLKYVPEMPNWCLKMIPIRSKFCLICYQLEIYLNKLGHIFADIFLIIVVLNSVSHCIWKRIDQDPKSLNFQLTAFSCSCSLKVTVWRLHESKTSQISADFQWT